MFQKRVTLLQNISHMAIMAAINIVFVLIANLIPVLSILLVLVLPLTSAITMIFCEKKYYFIYALGTLGVCLLVSINNISDALFYVLPSLITGAVFGLAAEKGLHSIWSISLATICQFALTMVTIPLITLISGVNFIDLINNFLKITDAQLQQIVPVLFIFVLSLAQIILSFIVVKEELKKLQIELVLDLKKQDQIILFFVLLLMIVLELIFGFVYLPVAYITMILSIIYCVILIIKNCMSKVKWVYVSTAICFGLSIVIVAILFPLLDMKYGFLFLNLYAIIPLITSIIYFLKINVYSKV